MPATTTSTTPPTGGAAVVAVWQEPDPLADTITGRGVAALVFPQLHRAAPDGTWEPSAIDASSVAEADDLRSVDFALAPGIAWSDGSTITADDLRRDADPIVESIETLDDGSFRVTFAQPFPNWRSLWSGGEFIRRPGPGLFGGPFVVESLTQGERTVLTPNPAWPGPGPYLERLELALVPDEITASQLIERGDVDVVMPRPSTRRSPLLAEIDGVVVDRVEDGSTGWRFGFAFSTERIDRARRVAIASLVDPAVFVATLLDGEARVFDGFTGQVGWHGSFSPDPRAVGSDQFGVTFVSTDPVAGFVHRVMARAVPDGVQVDGRSADADSVAGLVNRLDYDAALVWSVDDPGGCWRCFDPTLGLAADAGDAAAAVAVEQALRDDGVVVPLWRPIPMVAFRSGLVGPAANGWARIGAWNADEWYRS